MATPLGAFKLTIPYAKKRTGTQSPLGAIVFRGGGKQTRLPSWLQPSLGPGLVRSAGAQVEGRRLAAVRFACATGEPVTWVNVEMADSGWRRLISGSRYKY
jgi:hypothetical protein